METMNLNGMQVIVLSQPGLQNEQLTHRGMKPRLVKQLIGLGVVHILNGVFCIIFQSISLKNFVDAGDVRYGPPFSLAFFGHGLWSGLLFLVTGIIGITAGTRKSSCQVVAFNILSIISAAIGCIMTILAAVSAFFISMHRSPCTDQYYLRNGYCATDTHVKATTILVMESMLAVMGFLECIIAIWSSVVCCLIGVCGCCRAAPSQTQPMILSVEQQAALMSNPMFMSNQQQAAVGFNQQQTVHYNKQQPNAPPYAYNNFMSAATVEGSYTGLNTGMRRSLPSPGMDVSACITTSIYDELHEYEEVEQSLKF